MPVNGGCSGLEHDILYRRGESRAGTFPEGGAMTVFFSRLVIIAVMALTCLFSWCVQAETARGPKKSKPVTVTLFWGMGCHHCEREKAFLEDLKKRYPLMDVRELEIWQNKKNADLYRKILNSAEINQAAVPGTLVGTLFFTGFDSHTGDAIEEAVVRCLRKGCPDIITQGGTAMVIEAKERGPFFLPLIGTVDPAKVSLPFFTLVIAALDSINPCAFFVLLFLLSLLVHARSRKRMYLVGGIFVFFSGIIYFIFMAAWLSVFRVIGSITAVTLAGGLTAFFIGIINIKDFFIFGKGVSLSIPEKAKPRLFKRMRGLVQVESLSSLVVGTVMLAVAANTYEVLCTAGFPMVYTRVLTLQKMSAFQYYQYLMLYNLIYVVPLILIVVVITLTLGARKLTPWQGRKLKLLSGFMMSALGVILIVNPALLGNVFLSALLLVGIILLSAAVIAITRRLRPEIAEEREVNFNGGR